MADENLVNIPATKIQVANVINQNHFACVSQFDVKEQKTYTKAMQKSNATQ